MWEFVGWPHVETQENCLALCTHQPLYQAKFLASSMCGAIQLLSPLELPHELQGKIQALFLKETKELTYRSSRGLDGFVTRKKRVDLLAASLDAPQHICMS